MIHTGVKALFDEFDQPGGYQIVVVHGFGVIPDRGRIAHDHEDIAQAEGMGSQQVALDTQQIPPTCREVQGGFHADLTLDDIADRPGRHAHARHGTIGHIDHIRAGFLEQGSPGNEFMGGETARRVHFGGNDKFPFRQFLGQLGRRFAFGDFRSLRLLQYEWRTCAPQPGGLAASALRMAAICSGVVPQQPPMILAPASQKARA